jgi:hypothetical protein
VQKYYMLMSVIHGRDSMPLTPFLEGTVFGPDEITVMVGAYEAALREMDLTGHTASGAVTLAKTIVMLAKQGERDPVRLRERAIELCVALPPDAAAGG